MRLNKFSVFLLGSFASCIMLIISVTIGASFPYLVSEFISELICVILFFGFGLYLVYEALFEPDKSVRFPLKGNDSIGNERRKKRDRIEVA